MPDRLKTSNQQGLSREELLVWANKNLAFYKLPLSRISTVFLMQAYASEAEGIFSTFDLTQPIKVLEGISAADDTCPADSFKDPILFGLSKKHFTSARFIFRNLSDFIRSKFGNEYFQKVFDEALAVSGSGHVDHIFIKYLAHQMTFPPLAMRSQARKFTGEWLVFYPHEEVRYYLCLGFHSQGMHNQDANRTIRTMVDLACEFDNLPFRLPSHHRPY